MLKVVIAIAGLAVACGTQALAADMVVKAPPVPPAQVYSWTGFYIGGNVGYGWKDPTVSIIPNDLLTSFYACSLAPNCPPVSFQIDGVLGGLQLGQNWQINQSWLLGLETDFDASRIKGTGTSNFPVLSFQSAGFPAAENIKWFGTIRGRLGYLPAKNLLLYATGGFAYGRIDEKASLAGSGNIAAVGVQFTFSAFCTPFNPNCFTGNSSRTGAGFTVGGGAEYKVSQNVSLKAEYLYVNLGNGNAFNVVAQKFATAAPGTTPAPGSFTAAYSRPDFNVLRIGLNYQFH